MKKILALILALLMIVGVLASCGGGNKDNDDLPDNDKEQNEENEQGGNADAEDDKNNGTDQNGGNTGDNENSGNTDDNENSGNTDDNENSGNTGDNENGDNTGDNENSGNTDDNENEEEEKPVYVPTLESTEGLSFSLNEDGKSYSVIGIGTCTADEIIIDGYNGLPVTSIGEKAFYNCDSLTNVTIGKGVTSIKEDAFNGCYSLTGIYYDGNIASWCNINFENINSNPLYCAKNLYLNRNLVTTLKIPDGVTEIKPYAFSGCSSLTNITIPASVTNIGQYAFSNLSSLIRMGTANAYIDCDNITSIYYDGNIASWCNISFENRSSNPLHCAEKFHIKNSSGEYELVTDIVIPNMVTEIKSYTFCNYKSLTSVTIHNNVTSIGDDAFYGCDKLVEIVDKSNLNITKGSSNNGYIAKYALEVHNGESKIVNKDEYLFYTYAGTNYLLGYTGAATALILPKQYSSQNYKIYRYAFYERNDITSVTISDGVTSIGEDAFYHCTKLTSITIGKNITSIDYGAFDCCAELTEINFNATALKKFRYSPPNRVFSYAGQNGYGITFKIGSNVTKIPENIFYDSYPKITSVVFADGSVCKSIGQAAFQTCEELKNITIPNSITSIGNYAFCDCNGLTSVTIGNGVESIGDYAFSDCTELTNITIPDNVTSIGAVAFENCTNLKNINIGNGVTRIGRYAFERTAYYENKSNWENGVLYIGKYLIEAEDTMSGAYAIKSGTKVIAESAFDDCKYLTNVNIPNSVISMDTWAFSGCSSLTSVTIPDSVTIIGNYAFLNCNSLTSVEFKNTVGWKTSSTAISSTDLEDKGKAATYLKSTYYNYTWTRS